jgi:hypothetical protein
MGQFQGQPDFATNNIKEITATNTINQANYLDSSIIYIGDNTTSGDVMIVIPSGTVGPSVISGFSSPYSGSGGSGYTAANGVATTTNGSGTGLTVDTTVVAGAVTAIVINAAGSGYLNGDLITVSTGGANAVFRVNAEAGLPTGAQSVTFHGLQAGGFLPVTVDYVLATQGGETTTVERLIAAR